MPLYGLIEKARDLIASAWRTQGAPDSDELATEDFLKKLSKEFASTADQNGHNMDWHEAGPHSEAVKVDEEGFDCRIGKRARKRRREARKTVDVKQKPAETRNGGDRRKRAKPVEEKSKGKIRPPTAQRKLLRPQEKDLNIGSLPPGWQVVVHDSSSIESNPKANLSVGYLSWEGTAFGSLALVQKYCRERGIQLPKKGTLEPDDEVETVTLEAIQGWIAEAGRRGAVLPGRSFQIAAIKARQKLFLGPTFRPE